LEHQEIRGVISNWKNQKENTVKIGKRKNYPSKADFDAGTVHRVSAQGRECRDEKQSKAANVPGARPISQPANKRAARICQF